jgi:hypothetical protein
VTTSAGAIRSLSVDIRSFSGNAREMIYEVRSKPVDPSIMLLATGGMLLEFLGTLLACPSKLLSPPGILMASSDLLLTSKECYLQTFS